jgi:hypothetical protein
VFHCPQDGQRPCHRGVSLPQFEQRKTVLAAFIGFLQKFQHAAAQNCRKLLLIFRRAQQGLLRRVGQETALHEHGGAAHMLQKVDLPRFFAGPVIVWIELRSKCGLQPLRKRTSAAA